MLHIARIVPMLISVLRPINIGWAPLLLPQFVKCVSMADQMNASLLVFA